MKSYSHVTKCISETAVHHWVLISNSQLERGIKRNSLSRWDTTFYNEEYTLQELTFRSVVSTISRSQESENKGVEARVIESSLPVANSGTFTLHLHHSNY